MTSINASRAEIVNKNGDLPFTLTVDQLDLSVSNIYKDYPKSCLPTQFKKPSGAKAKQLQYEHIDPDFYEAHARMVAFRIKHQRLDPWIRALQILYYEHYGKTDKFTVNWYDEPNDWSNEDNKTICIDLVKHDQLLYKITVFINTGVIQAQGLSKDTFTTRDFPVLKMLVNSICNFGDDSDSDTEVKKCETSSTVQVDSETAKKSHDDINNNETVNVQISVDKSHTTPKSKTENNTLPNSNMSKDIALLQDAFTDAPSCMNSSQSSLLQQLGNSLCKAIETSIRPVIDNLKQQLHAIQQLNENVKKKERQNDTQSEIRKLQDNVKQLQTEKFETAIEISKLQSQVESEKMKKESIHTKMESTIKSLQEDNENLREKLCQQKSEYEKLMSDYKLLSAKCDCHFEENLSLKSQLSSSFGCFGQKEDTPSDVNATPKNDGKAYKETTRKPTALLIGTSNISGIKPNKLSQYVEIKKAIAYTLDETTTKIEMCETQPDVVLLHPFTNDIKEHTPEKCVEKLEKITNIISSKWNNTKTIVSLTTPRMDDEIHRINSEILDGLIKRNYISQPRKDVLISENANLWHSNNHVLKPDKYHLSDQGTSMLASNLKNSLHSSLGIKQVQPNSSNPKTQRWGTNQAYDMYYGRNPYTGNGDKRGGRGYY